MVYTKKYLKKIFLTIKKKKSYRARGGDKVVTYFSLRTKYKTIVLYMKIYFVIFKKILETWD